MTALAPTATGYYADKLSVLADLFGTNDVVLGPDSLRVGQQTYPIIDDVIVLLPREQWPAALRTGDVAMPARHDFARDIQQTFGEEWKSFPEITAEHERIFAEYFDLIALETLAGRRIMDLGSGMGRWSQFVAPRCRELILVDFSEAIFVARRNLVSHGNALFFLGDVTKLPFRDDAADLAFSLGVLHHLPTRALDELRRLRRLAPRLLVYLYYALDNRPAHYRALLKGVTALRSRLSRVEGRRTRHAISWGLAAAIYRPLVGLGHLARPFGLSSHVPLHEGYRGKSFRLLQQDAYDRFFTRIEQRVSRAEILALRDTFSKVTISDAPPYWHFVAER